LEAELEAEIEALRLAGEEEEKGAGMDGEAWGEEDDDDEDEDEDDEDYEEEAGLEEEEEEEGEEGGLIDWPVEGEGEEEDWGALTADGWIDMDAILVRTCEIDESGDTSAPPSLTISLPSSPPCLPACSNEDRSAFFPFLLPLSSVLSSALPICFFSLAFSSLSGLLALPLVGPDLCSDHAPFPNRSHLLLSPSLPPSLHPPCRRLGRSGGPR